MRLIIFGLLVFQIACSKESFTANDRLLQQQGSRTIASVGSLSVENQSKAFMKCEFISPDALSGILKNQLGIESGDLQGTMAGRQVNRIQANRLTLGAGDSTKGIASDTSCTPTKFKVATEILIDACVMMLQNSTARSKLFPNGGRDPEAAYLALIGRVPTASERTTLLELADALPADRLESGMCAAVASSLEALIRI